MLPLSVHTRRFPPQHSGLGFVTGFGEQDMSHRATCRGEVSKCSRPGTHFLEDCTETAVSSPLESKKPHREPRWRPQLAPTPRHTTGPSGFFQPRCSPAEFSFCSGRNKEEEQPNTCMKFEGGLFYDSTYLKLFLTM